MELAHYHCLAQNAFVLHSTPIYLPQNEHRPDSYSLSLDSSRVTLHPVLVLSFVGLYLVGEILLELDLLAVEFEHEAKEEKLALF